MKTRHTPLAATILAASVLLAGCVSFTGPNDIRRSITAAAPYALEQQEAVSVGPVGIFMAQVFIGNMLPISLGGLESVSFGSYDVRPLSAGASTALPVADLELEGWERIVRVREADSEFVLMVGSNDRTLRRLLVLNREGDELQIIRAKGDFERIIGEMLEAGWIDLGEADWGLDGGGTGDGDGGGDGVGHGAYDV